MDKKSQTGHNLPAIFPITRLLYGLAIAFFALVGCGSPHPHATKQKEVQLDNYPQYPAQQEGDSFVLSTDSTRILTYRTGSMLLLDPRLDAHDLAHLITIGKSVRLTRAQAVHFEQDNKQTMATLNDQISKLKILLVQKRKEFRANSRENIDISKRLNAAEFWFETEMNRSIRNDERRKSSLFDTFNGYCEAKIWQLAGQPYFASMKYVSRPTPLALCEKYYVDHGFFDPNAESCKDASNDEGKYFLPCLWQEGVMKTALFKSHFSNKKQVFDSLFTPANLEDFRRILSEDRKNSETHPIIAGRKIYTQINTALMSLSSLPKCNRERFYELKIPALCTIFERENKPELVRDGKTGTANLSPAELIKLVEDGADVTYDLQGKTLVARDFPLPPPSNGTKSYGQLIKFFAGRERTAPSESDSIFHKPAIPDKVVAPAHSTEVMNEISIYQDSFAGVYTKFSEQDQLALNTIEDQIKEADSRVTDITAQQAILDTHVTDLLSAAIKAAQVPHLAYAFMNMGTEIIKSAHTYSLEIWFGEDSRQKGVRTKRIKGCYDIVTHTAVVTPDCLDSPEFQIHADTFKYNPETGEIVAAFKFNSTTDLGMLSPKIDSPNSATREHKDDYFNDIPLNLLAGKTIEFQLFPNTVAGVVNILTGKVVVKDAGWQEGDSYRYEGVADFFDNK